MEVFAPFLNAGLADNQSDDVRQKIKLSNGIALYFIGMVFVYIGISIMLMPQILPFVIVSGIFYALVPVLNKMGMLDVSRFIAAVNPAIISFFIHISTIKSTEEPVLGNSLIQLSFILLPWILFDYKERLLLAFSFIISILCLLLVRPLNSLVEPEVTNELARSVGLEYIFMIISCVILAVILYIFQTFQINADKRNTLLQVESERHNLELQENEQKLNNYIAEIEENRIEEKKREWASKGIAKFAEILRQDNEDVSKTYDAIIFNIVKYMGANQGGLFVVEEEGDTIFLQLKACYAYDRKKFLNRKVEIGEGLIGQCYLERDIIFLTQVPKNYTLITSGLGDETPRCLLIVPLIINDEIYGIIEIASFKKFEPFEIEFLQKIGESIASAIANLKVTEKTKFLLSESLQQTEEMRAQEEEMRQNMEELSATQEEMSRKEKQLQVILDETKKKEENMTAMAFKQQEEVENIKAEVEKLQLKIKSKDKRIEELEAQLPPK